MFLFLEQNGASAFWTHTMSITITALLSLDHAFQAAKASFYKENNFSAPISSVRFILSLFSF